MTGSADEALAAAKAARFPTMSNNAGYYGLTTQPAYKVDLLGFTFGLPITQSSYLTSLSVINEPLYTSGRIKNNIAAAAAEVHAAQSEEAGTVLDLKMEIAEAYIRILYARQLVIVADANVTALQAHVKEINNLIQQKQRVKSDLLAVQVQLADANQAALQARNNLDLANASYNRFLGRPLVRPRRDR